MLKGRSTSIDLIRILACTAVVCFHWNFGPSILQNYGYLGVDIFFVISGIVVMSVILNNSVETPFGSTFFSFKFFLNRIIRLAPGLILATVSAFLIYKFTSFHFYSLPVNWKTIFTNMTLLNWPLSIPIINDPTWTLVCEVRFYVLMSIVILMSRSRLRSQNYWLSFLLLWLAIYLVSEIWSGRNPVYRALLLDPFTGRRHSGASYFIIGCGFALWKHYRNRLAGLIVVASLGLSMRQIYLFIEDAKPKNLTNLLLPELLFFVPVVLILIYPNWRLKNRFGEEISNLGRATYLVYLIHWYIGAYMRDRVIGKLFSSYEARRVISLLMLFLLSYLWVITIEGPVIGVANKFIYRKLTNFSKMITRG